MFLYSAWRREKINDDEAGRGRLAVQNQNLHLTIPSLSFSLIRRYFFIYFLATMKKSLLQRADDSVSVSPMVKRPRLGIAEEPPAAPQPGDATVSPRRLHTLTLPTPGSASDVMNVVAYTLSISPDEAATKEELAAAAAVSCSTPDGMLSPPSPNVGDSPRRRPPPPSSPPAVIATTSAAATVDTETKSAADILIATANIGRPVVFYQPVKKESKQKTASVTDTKVETTGDTKESRVTTMSLPVKSDKSANGEKICNCRKSKCLKLYCECFSSGAACGADCGTCEKLSVLYILYISYQFVFSQPNQTSSTSHY